MSQNHVIDPTYFYDAIEEFAFDFNLYVASNKDLDDRGRSIISYQKRVIRGSLQSKGKRWTQSKSGNTSEKTYRFYCKSLYRIDTEDILEYKNNYYIVTDVQDYDEYGVRSCSLSMIKLSAYKDLRDYIRYLEGEVLV